MGDTVFLPLEDYFNRTGMRRAVTMCQLPMTITVAFIVTLAVLFNPDTLSEPAFVLVLIVHALILMACILVPWDRLPRWSFVLVPMVDCFAIAFMREVGGPVLSVVGLVMTFPVIWLSVSASRMRVILAFLAPLVATIASPLMLGSGVERSDLIRMIVFPAIMAGLAITGHTIARGLIRHRDNLKRKERELEQLHETTKDHAQLMDAVLETVTVGVWAMNTEGADILTNRRLRADRSWAEGATAPGQENPFTPARGPSEPGENPARLAIQGANFSQKLVRVGTDNQQRTFSAAARPLHDAQGRLKGSTLAFTDVTDLVQAQASRDKFVSSVSHELRTPLTSILGYMEVLGDRPEPRILGIIQRNASRLLSLVNDLLMVASEDLELRRQPTNLSELLHQSARAATPAAAAKGITITTQSLEDITAVVDPNQFAKAIDHVLSNAIKFSPDDSPVTLGLEQHDGRIEFSVCDQGIGMTGQELDQAFTKFYRADHALASTIPGAGLGLPLSKAIVEAHGGTIKLNSQPGSGTTVTITLPG
jgi:signal transduction histidine kinase